MSRILLVARSEFLALVRTKAFIIGVLMGPLMVALSIGFQMFAARRADVSDRSVAVIDRTGALYEALVAAAAEHNAAAGQGVGRTGPHFLLGKVDLDGVAPADAKVGLSDRVRRRELFAFVDIPAEVLGAKAMGAEQVEYYTDTPSYTALPDWLDRTIEQAVSTRRLTAASVDPDVVKTLTRPVELARLGLLDRRADGSISEAQRVNVFQTVLLPFGMMYLLSMALMSGAPPLLTAVIEEKMSRISEVLLASITPFQLMMGKLLGAAAVSVLLALVYFSGASYAALSAGQSDFFQWRLIGWFLVFLVMGVLMFGSVFIAIGAACSDLKDAQSMMQPIMVILILPLLAVVLVLRAPDSQLTVVLSLIPTASPFLMILRLAMTPPPPLWQVLLALLLTSATALGCVWAAGRIFRVGLLMQGKPPNLPELMKWIRQ